MGYWEAGTIQLSEVCELKFGENKSTHTIPNKTMTWLPHWITYPVVPGSKPLGDSMGNSNYYPSKVDQMSTGGSWGIGD